MIMDIILSMSLIILLLIKIDYYHIIRHKNIIFLSIYINLVII